MLTLHHLNNSRSQRILWLLEELEVDYHLEKYQRDATTSLAPPELKAVHSLGRSPVLTTEYGAIAESGAIVEYLIANHGKGTFVPPEKGPRQQEYLFWMHFAEGSLMPPMVARMVLDKAKEKAKPVFIKPLVNKIVHQIYRAYYGPNLEQSLRYIESWLSSHEWFSGDGPGGADVQMIFPLESLVATGKVNSMACIRAYVKRVHERPAYQRALEKGGKYAYA